MSRSMRTIQIARSRIRQTTTVTCLHRPLEWGLHRSHQSLESASTRRRNGIQCPHVHWPTNKSSRTHPNWEQVERLHPAAIRKLLAVLISKTKSMHPRQWWQVHWLEIPKALIAIRYQGRSDYSQEPSVNAICERMHQTIDNTLQTVVYTNPLNNAQEANRLIDNALATAMHKSRCSVNATPQNSPGSIVFNRDMFIDVPLIADLVTIQNRCQALVDKNLRRQNKKRWEHTYAIRQLVYMKTYDPTKMEEKLHGHYPILQVYMNGTVDINSFEGTGAYVPTFLDPFWYLPPSPQFLRVPYKKHGFEKAFPRSKI